jgi:hypothetical protein
MKKRKKAQQKEAVDRTTEQVSEPLPRHVVVTPVVQKRGPLHAVEKIVAVGRHPETDELQYKVRWEGCGEDKDSWRSKDELLETCEPLVQEFERAQKRLRRQ